MGAARYWPRRSRPVRIFVVLVVLVLAGVAGACSSAGSPGVHTEQQRSSGAALRSASSPPSSSTSAPSGPAEVAIGAVGDVIMGATPQLPPEDGRQLFDAVAGRLGADVVLANLDQTLTDRPGPSKCGAASSGCFAFRTPPFYAQWLRQAGVTVINLANNHSHDFGDAGLADTQQALTAHGVRYTGMPGQITVQPVGALRVAIVGFAPYPWAQSLLDLPAAAQLVRQAATQADLVIVTIHAGAEGADTQHVRPGTETFLGEDRGDPMAFSRTVIDAGADAVLGSGPHVLRGMQWYRGRLIAYSLGNFLGYRTLAATGPLGVGGILTLHLAADGSWHGGQLTGTRMMEPGLPQIDPDNQALTPVRQLSRADFGPCGVDLSATGDLNAPTC